MNAQPITAADAASTVTGSGLGGQSVVTGTPTTGSAVGVPVGNGGLACVQVSGTFSATLVVENSYDGGVTWYAVILTPIGETGTVTSITVIGAATYDCRGATNTRARCPATDYTSGTANVGFSLYGVLLG
jgi:hypothetical protein